MSVYTNVTISIIIETKNTKRDMKLSTTIGIVSIQNPRHQYLCNNFYVYLPIELKFGRYIDIIVY